MLQSLKRTRQLDPDDGELHTNMVDFILACEGIKVIILNCMSYMNLEP